MQASNSPAPQVPPAVARYLAGPPAASRQFDFLLGDWEVAGTRYQEDGSPLLQYKATWSAKALNEGRMILDDFQALAPTGQAVSSYVTLRTYCEVTKRWEMAGLSAHQPAISADWSGEWRDGEMLLEASGKDPEGRLVLTRIRFFDIATDSFQWDSRSSRDAGSTWVRTASLAASRASRA